MTTIKKYNKFILGCVFLLLYILCWILLKNVDVAAYGPKEAEIGLSSVNVAIRDAIGTHETLDKMTDIVGVLPFLSGVFFFGVGLIQWIKRKNLFQVDSFLFILAAFYLLCFAFYFFFEVVTVNYRPILVDGELDPSFPSSHTFFSVFLLGSAAIIVRKAVETSKTQIALRVLLYAILALIILMRFFSGVHWATDILGGILLSVSLLFFFDFVLSIVYSKKEGNES